MHLAKQLNCSEGEALCIRAKFRVGPVFVHRLADKQTIQTIDLRFS